MQSQTSDGVIAQLVEQRTENPCVPGSIPGDTTNENLQLIEFYQLKILVLTPTPILVPQRYHGLE